VTVMGAKSGHSTLATAERRRGRGWLWPPRHGHPHQASICQGGAARRRPLPQGSDCTLQFLA